MKKLLLVAGIITFLVTAAFAYVIAPPIPPLLDDNRLPLAESVSQGYCSGMSMMAGVDLEECWEDEASRGTVRNLSAVQSGFCYGIIAGGWNRTHNECMEIMETQRFWPLLEGGITNSWSARYPYPLDRFVDNITPDESRTGTREGEERT